MFLIGMYYPWTALYGLIYTASDQLAQAAALNREIIAVVLMLYVIFPLLLMHRINTLHF